MSVVDDIRSKRPAAFVHCGFLPESLTLPAVASAFSLSPEATKYHKITKAEALQVLTRVLHRDMAFDSEIMPASVAAGLSASFLQGFEDDSATFFTNIDCSKMGKVARNTWAGPDWRPVTEATFDAGVIAISGFQSACLWIEDED